MPALCCIVNRGRDHGLVAVTHLWSFVIPLDPAILQHDAIIARKKSKIFCEGIFFIYKIKI